MGNENQRFLSAFPEQARLTPELIRDVAKSHPLYAIFFTPRSGSSWLMDMCQQAELGRPMEWFSTSMLSRDFAPMGLPSAVRLGAKSLDDYVARIAALSAPGEPVGIKLPWWDLKAILPQIEWSSIAGSFKSFFYLTRKDTVAQAISIFRSSESNLWHSFQDDKGAKQKFETVDYDAAKITKWLRHIQACEDSFEKLFASCGLAPIRLFYEDVEANPTSVLMQVNAALGQPPRVIEPRSTLNRLRTDLNSEWAARYRREQGEGAALKV